MHYLMLLLLGIIIALNPEDKSRGKGPRKCILIQRSSDRPTRQGPG